MTFAEGRHETLIDILRQTQTTEPAGLLADLGVSSLQLDDPERGLPLERHDRQPHDIRRDLGEQPRDGLGHPTLRENQVGHGHPVMRIDIAGEGRKRAVGHADSHRGHVLEPVGHRQQENVHRLRAAYTIVWISAHVTGPRPRWFAVWAASPFV